MRFRYTASELVTSWQERAARYPDGLRLAVVRAHAQIEGLWRLDAYAARGNPVAGYQVLTAAHEDVLHTLLASEPRVLLGLQVAHRRSSSDLPIAPTDLLDRIRASYPLAAGH